MKPSRGVCGGDQPKFVNEKWPIFLNFRIILESFFFEELSLVPHNIPQLTKISSGTRHHVLPVWILHHEVQALAESCSNAPRPAFARYKQNRLPRPKHRKQTSRCAPCHDL